MLVRVRALCVRVRVYVRVSDCACVGTCAFVMNACECVCERGHEQKPM